MMEKIPIFTDWLYEWDVPQDILDVALGFALDAPYHSGGKNHTSYPEHFFADGFDPVRKWVDARLDEIRLDLNMEFEFLKSTVFWTTKSHQGQWHHCHKHGISFASGIIYLSPSSAETWFSRESIWGPKHTSIALHDVEKSSLLHKRKTEVGKLIVFPSGLLHSVTEHDRLEPRYCMSFNSYPSGLLGSFSDKHSRRLLNITVNQKQ
jgi:hypothetical protein